MLSTDRLEAFAAAFSALSSIQLEPASDEIFEAVTAILDEWPLPREAGAKLSDDQDCENQLTKNGMQLTDLGLNQLQASSDSVETYDQRFHDQDLLYGISSTSKVPPFESVHRSPDGLVFDLETLAVRECYRKLDLEAPKLNSEPDDHIGLEINFLMTACLRAHQALTSGDQQEATRLTWIAADFTRDHLLQWAPQMLAEATQAAQTHWVKGMELLTLGTILLWARALLSCGALSNDGCCCHDKPQTLTSLSDTTETDETVIKLNLPQDAPADEQAPLRRLSILPISKTLEKALISAQELVS